MITLLGVLALAGVFWLGRLSASASVPVQKCCAQQYCGSQPDPRCVAGNCTMHCALTLGCNGRCLDAFARSDKAEELARAALSKARAK